MENKLTFSQQLILDCIYKYYDENLEMPTLTDLCHMSSINTKSTVHEHLRNLQKKGYIRVIPKLKRGIRFINND
jgi:repressor LexA